MPQLDPRIVEALDSGQAPDIEALTGLDHRTIEALRGRVDLADEEHDLLSFGKVEIYSSRGQKLWESEKALAQALGIALDGQELNLCVCVDFDTSRSSGLSFRLWSQTSNHAGGDFTVGNVKVNYYRHAKRSPQADVTWGEYALGAWVNENVFELQAYPEGPEEEMVPLIRGWLRAIMAARPAAPVVSDDQRRLLDELDLVVALSQLVEKPGPVRRKRISAELEIIRSDLRRLQADLLEMMRREQFLVDLHAGTSGQEDDPKRVGRRVLEIVDQLQRDPNIESVQAQPSAESGPIFEIQFHPVVVEDDEGVHRLIELPACTVSGRTVRFPHSNPACHPHVYKGVPCLGNGDRPIAEALKRDDIVTAAAVLGSWLQQIGHRHDLAYQLARQVDDYPRTSLPLGFHPRVAMTEEASA